ASISSLVLAALDIKETVDDRIGTFAVIEIRQCGQAPKHQGGDQQRDGTRPVDLTQFRGLRAIEYSVEWRRVLLRDALPQGGDRGAVGGPGVTRLWQLFEIAPQGQPAHG